MLTVVDSLLSEYGWGLDYVLFELPIAQAFALYAAIAARYGNERTGPTFADLDLLDELDRHGLPDAPRRKRGRKRRGMKR